MSRTRRSFLRSGLAFLGTAAGLAPLITSLSGCESSAPPPAAPTTGTSSGPAPVVVEKPVSKKGQMPDPQ